MAGQSQGADAKIAINGTTMEVFEMDPGVEVGLIDNSDRALGRGRSHFECRVSQGLIKVRPRVKMNPSPLELDVLLPLILGSAESADTFNVAEQLPEFPVEMDLVAEVPTLAMCKVDKATFRSSKDNPLELEIEMIGKTVSLGGPGSFSGGDPDCEIMYVHHDGVLTLRSQTRLFDRVAVVIDNMLEDEFNNSQTATDIHARDRQVYLACNTPWTADEIDLFSAPLADADGAAGSLVYTSTNVSTAFTFANLKELARLPEVLDKRAIRLPVTLKAFATSSTDELVVTHDGDTGS